MDTTYQVQAWGNGRGGIDAEWERFHDAWRNSFTVGSFFQGQLPPSGFYPQPPHARPKYQPHGTKE